MKLSNVLLLSLCAGVQSCLAATSQFINLVPYQNAQCSGSPSGFGLSGAANQCLTFDYATNWLLTTSGNSVNLSPYYNKGGVTLTCENPKNSGFTFNVGDCVAANDLWLENVFVPTENSQWFYKVQVSKNAPYIAPNSFVIPYMYPVCELENSLMVQYFTNGTVVYDAIVGNNQEFFCENNTPYTMGCTGSDSCEPPAAQDYSCQQAQPFINTTKLNNQKLNRFGSGLFGGLNIQSNSKSNLFSGSTGSGSISSGSVSGTGSASASSTGSFSSSVEDSSSSSQDESSSQDSSSSSQDSSSSGQYYFSSYCS